MSTVQQFLEAITIQSDIRDVPLFVKQDGEIKEYGGFTIWIGPDGMTPTAVVIFGKGEEGEG